MSITREQIIRATCLVLAMDIFGASDIQGQVLPEDEEEDETEEE